MKEIKTDMLNIFFNFSFIFNYPNIMLGNFIGSRDIIFKTNINKYMTFYNINGFNGEILLNAIDLNFYS